MFVSELMLVEYMLSIRFLYQYSHDVISLFIDKLRFREIKKCVEGHTATKCISWKTSPGLAYSKAITKESSYHQNQV